MNKKNHIKKHLDNIKSQRCINCIHAALTQHGNNPIIAACKLKPNKDITFPSKYECFVANMHHCQEYELNMHKTIINSLKST